MTWPSSDGEKASLQVLRDRLRHGRAHVTAAWLDRRLRHVGEEERKDAYGRHPRNRMLLAPLRGHLFQGPRGR